MSVYEPDVVRKLLSALEPKNLQKRFEASWNITYEWEAEVVEYINYISDKTRTRSTKALARPCLDSKVPILGPHFLLPSYLYARKRNQSEPAINPEILYLKALCAIHPFYYPELAKCLRCDGTNNVRWDGWTGTGPRDVHGLMVDEAAIGTQLHCENCKNNATRKEHEHEHSDLDNGCSIKTNLKGYCFTTTNPDFWGSWTHWSIPVTRDLFNLLVEMRPSSTAGSLAENIRSMRESESEEYLRTLSGVSISFDNTFHAVTKATVTSREKKKLRVLKGGIISLMNENGEIVGWSNTEISKLLQGLKMRCGALDVPPPEIFVANNCCHVCSAVAVVFPGATMKLDVWHFIMRLTSVFEKWSCEGTVWSAGAHKVHEEQLKHAHKGCLERPWQDIWTDGSHVEGSHKGWNSLRRAHTSGIVTFTVLCHDFVLHHNIHVAFSRATKSDFLSSTHGSHHVHLVDGIAKLFNHLRLEEKTISWALAGAPSSHPSFQHRNGCSASSNEEAQGG
ncbi:hypothetical protein C8R48DRAFT_750296 [Suillus tomentosus]|nr:hypothetical protein C8R48DRAFT_750296 [Suillus tomentosus]